LILLLRSKAEVVDEGRAKQSLVAVLKVCAAVAEYEKYISELGAGSLIA